MHQALLSLFAIVAHLHVVSSVSSSVEGGSHKPHKLLRAEQEDPAGSHGVDEKKIERQAAWAERLERRQLLTPRQTHQTEHSQRVKQALADLATDIEKAAKNQKTTKKPDWPTKCKKNTYIMDWGSTGARVFLAHEGTASEALLDGLPDSEGDIWGDKISIKEYLKVGSDSAAITTLLNFLHDNVKGSTNMAAAATAGNRLSRPESQKAWKELQKGNANTKVLQDCTTSSDKGCLTIPGSQEAEYEFKSAYDGNVPAESGMISAGGASLQLAFTVADGDATKASECAAAIQAVTGLNGAVVEHIHRAANFDSTSKLLTFSWLADRKHKKDETHLTSQLLVGGANEMRAAFDRYVANTTSTAWSTQVQTPSTLPVHPCLKNDWPPARTSTAMAWGADEQEEQAGASGTPFLTDVRHSFYSVLKGNSNAKQKACVDKVRAFVKADFMIKAFQQTGKHCLDLSKKVKKWRLITSFARVLGGAGSPLVDKLKEKLSARTSAAASADIPAAGDDNAYTTWFEETLLLTIMDELGMFETTTTIDKNPSAEWLAEFGKALTTPLKPGWLKDSDC